MKAMETPHFSQYIETIRHFQAGNQLPQSLHISDGPKGLATYYAPFEYINKNARVVICGITPGLQQANKALTAATLMLTKGAGVEEALAIAKNTGSFAGAMRTNIVMMLDHIGLHNFLGIDSCAALFDSRKDLIHYTSALRFPVFKNGENYSGDKSMVNDSYLWEQSKRQLSEEICTLDGALWIPLGQSVVNVFEKLISICGISEDRVLFGLPHASGANAERIKYFVGAKNRKDLSNKVNPDLLDQRKDRLIRKISELSA